MDTAEPFYRQERKVQSVLGGAPKMVAITMLIRVRPGSVWEACDAIKKIEGVQRAQVVTGPYDIVVYAELDSTEELRRITEAVHAVEGIARTETCVAI